MTIREETKEKIVALRDEARYSWVRIGDILGIDRRTAKKYYESKSVRLISEESLVDATRFQPMVAKGDMLVTSDFHVPLHDPKMVNHVIRKAHENSIKTLIIGGDFWNLDSLSHYSPHQKEAGLEFERETGLVIIDALLDTFQDIYFFWGNHDVRFAKYLDFKLSFVYAMQMLWADLGPEKLGRIKISDLDYMHLYPGSELYRMSHQKNFSMVPLTVPRQLAQKHHSHIICAHSHHCAMGVALDGKHLIFEAGGLFDKTKTEYVQKTNTHHEWVQGFLMFKDGIPTQYSPAYGNL